MTYRRRIISYGMCAIASPLLLAAACGSPGEGGNSGGKGGGPPGASGAGTGGNPGAGAGGSNVTPGTTGGAAQTGGAPGTGGAAQSGGAPSTGGTAQSGGAPGTGGAAQTSGAPGTGGAAPSGGAAGTGGSQGKGGAGQAGGTGGQGGAGAGGGKQTGGAGGAVSSCVGKAWSTADPTIMGSFQVAADKGVGPLAGALPDPVYGDKQQRFNVYRPKDLAQGYCHPILVWANGHTDNPEPNPPDCVSSKYCGSYLMLVNQMASHGFVVIASLSTITSQGNPLPTIVGLDWLLQQAEDPSSPYYHHLDTAHIGAFGHSEGGFSSCKAASDPRISAISTVSGSSANPAFHQPVLLFCGGKDTVVSCDSVSKTFSTITDQPAMLIDNLAADHGGWLYQNGAKGPDIFGMTAWFRYYLMGDMQQRNYFFGPSCTFCTDSRVTVMRNSLLTQ